MIIYEDIVSGDELISDTYPQLEVKDGDDVIAALFAVQSKNVKKTDDDVDIGCGDAFGGGEEDDGPVDDSVQIVNDIQDAFNYTETGFGSKKEFMGAMKSYMKKLSKEMPEDKVADFQKEASAAVGYLKKNFKELQFFMGPSMDPSGTMVFALYPEGAEAPLMMYFKWGLKEEKV